MDAPYYVYLFHDYDQVNPDVMAEYQRLLDSGHVRKSHLFAGRYENIYVDRNRIAGLSMLIPFWIDSAAEVLGRQSAELRCGFWFNDMQPGDVTLPHTHDDDDEWLSGVYYLQVPADSGDLVIRHQGEKLQVAPEDGKLVLFPANAMHEVEKNRSQQRRLSIGINFGSVAADIQPQTSPPIA